MAYENHNVSSLLQTKAQRAPRTESRPATREKARVDSAAAKWTKAALVGALGSLTMFVIIMAAIGSGIAPFNSPPSAAFLEYFGLNVGPLALMVHFGYGVFWSIVLVALFREKITVIKGNFLALALWLFMMVVYSPLMGWGLFGFEPAAQLPSNHPLYLNSGPQYLVATLLLHVIYGSIIGWLNPKWIKS